MTTALLPDARPQALTPSRRATLDALVETILPHLRESRDASDVSSLVVARLARAPAGIPEDVARALDVLGSRLAGFVATGKAMSFFAMDAPARARALEAWGNSAAPVARTVYQSLRRLVLATYYARPAAQREIGVLPPLHTRLPGFPWEGPLVGAETLDAEPVARTPHPGGRVPRGQPAARAVPHAVVTPNELRGDLRLTADAVVVGSGAGGGVVAAQLAESGREVVMLEEGAYLDAPDFSGDEGEMVPRLFADQGVRATVDASVLLLQGGTVGGGTTVNWMVMERTPDEVLDEWRLVHGLEGYTAAALAPVFDRIERDVHARTVPDDAHSPSNQVILDGSRALGWKAHPARINARDCVRAGTCSLGCRYDAKQGGLRTYLPRAFAAGARLYTGARAERLEVLDRATPAAGPTPARKRVHAMVRDPGTGEERGRLVIDAPIVVLAAGAVGTPALLERSGLGGGGVGRYLRLHPTSVVTGRYDREMYPLAGVPLSAICDEFRRRDAHGHGFWIECPALLPALAAVALSGFGPAHRERMLALRQSVSLIVLVRDGSGEDTSQGCVWVDAQGRTRIRYRLTAADRANLVEGVVAAARVHLAAGAREAESLHTPPVRVADEAGLRALRAANYGPNRVTLFSAHVNGTCRMGVHPATSGTTPDGERHGVRGLYVADGSLLPTALGVNPQETIIALASVIAERIAAR